MKELLGIALCIGVCWLIEHLWGSYLDSLPKDKRDEFMKRQSQMCCKYCGSTDFEVIGMKHEKVKFQCRNCKKSDKSREA